MIRVFVSGATGFIGRKLVDALVEKGYIVHALYRSKLKAAGLDHPNIRLFKGDIMDLNSLEKAMEGCRQVYHTAAFANIWEKDRSLIYRLNIEGTIQVVMASVKSGVDKIVCTSTAGVIGSSGEQELHEGSPPPASYFIDYEASKTILEKVLQTFALTGPEIVIVNPTRVYGPGLLSESNGVTRMVRKYLQGKWRFIPGNGKSIGNYVHVDDVVTGHMLAMEKGKSGERYLLGGENVSYNEFFRILAGISGKNYCLIRIPRTIMLLIAYLAMLKPYIFGTPPMITPALAKKFSRDFRISSEKARNELGYSPRDLKEGLIDTLNWLLAETEK